jgi:hypothetical protein
MDSDILRLARRFGVAAALLAVAAMAVYAGLGTIVGLTKTDAGDVGVARNGGWFDDKQIRQVIQPASGLTWTGLWSTLHTYPAQQRYYTMTGDPERGGRPGISLAHAPTGDGVEMGIEATIYFTLNTDEQTLRVFDEKYGTRQYRTADGENMLYAWDGIEGWNAFFDGAVRPVIENDLRVELNKVTCAELVSSCALVRNGALGDATAPIVQTPGENNTHIAAIERSINQTLPVELRETLGGDFFQGISFNLVRVTLPGPVQEAVTRAQAQFAAISEAQAKVVQAEAEAEANKRRQEGYNACPACAQIDIVKALPPGVTTYAPGAGTSIPIR